MVVILVLFEDLGEGATVTVAVLAAVAVAHPVGIALTAVAVRPAPWRVVAVGNRVRLAVAVGVDRLLDQFRDQPRAAREDVLGADLAVADGVELVDVSGLALRPALDHALARVVVFVGLGVTVVRDLLYAVLLIPDNRAAGAVLDVFPTGLVAVQVIAVGTVKATFTLMRSPCPNTAD